MKIGKIKYLAVMMIAGAFISCGLDDDSTVSAQETSFLSGNVLHDSRDGHTYKTVTIGTQTWMAENLSYKMDGTICPGDDYCKTHKCHQYYGYSNPDDSCNPLPDTTIWPVAGCYYRSKSAISACPKGWHLPSLDEWKILFEAVGGKDIAGKMLKASSGFCGDNGRNSNGTDAYGFNVLPTGHCSLLNWEYYYNRVCNGKTENGKCVDGRGDTLYVPGQDDYIIGGAFPSCILGGGAGFWTSTYLGSGLCVNTKEINFAACEPTEIDVYLRVSFDTEWHSDSPDDVYYRIPEELRTKLGNEDYAELSSVRCLKDDASGPSTKSSSSMKKYSSSSTVKMSSSDEKTFSSSVAKSSSSSTAKSSSSVKITSSSSAKITSLSSSREQLKSSSSKVTPSSSSKKVVLSSSSTKQSSSSIDLDYYNRQMQGQKGSGLSWKASDGPFVQINENGVKTDWYYWTDSENGGSSGFNRGSVPNIADEKGSGKYTLKEVESIGGVGGKAVLGPSFMMKDSVFHVGSVESGFSGGSIKLPADKMLGLCLEYTNTFDYFVIQIIYDNDEANNWGRPEFHLPIATEKKIINLPWAVFQKISDWAFADVSVYDAIKVMKGVNFQAINNSSKEVFGEFVISKIGAYGTCDDQESVENTVGFMTDSRDGQTYKTVKIGSQTWMAENLNYKSANSYCYNDTVSYCAKYGRLYTWAAAMDSVGAWSSNGKGCGYDNVCSPQYPVQGVCPKGWHLPSRAEWRSLLSAVGGQSVAGTVLKTTSGWNSSGNGTDVFSFSMLPAGLKDDTGVYYDVGDDATFWSSTEGNRYLAHYMNFLDRNNEDADFYYYCMRKGFAYSVRCVKD